MILTHCDWVPIWAGTSTAWHVGVVAGTNTEGGEIQVRINNSIDMHVPLGGSDLRLFTGVTLVELHYESPTSVGEVEVSYSLT